MRYEEFDPPARHREHVLAFWHLSVAPGTGQVEHRIIPDGCMGLVVAMQAGSPPVSTLVGAHEQGFTVTLHASDRYAGIRFWPDTGGRMLGVDPRSWVGRRGLEVDPPPATRALLASVTDQPSSDHVVRALTAWCDATTLPRVDESVRRAVRAIVASRGSASIAAVAAQAALSPRQLQRRFGSATGLTPKQYCRVRRLRESAARLLTQPQPSWSNVAAELGYSDHAHLTREFVSMTGITPTEVEEYVARIEHGDVHP